MADPASADSFSHFNLHDRGARAGAECIWAKMREQAQLPHSDALGGFHIISRYAELKKALLDPGLFSSAQGITVPDQGVRSRHIPAETDPPLHKEYRNLMARHFGFDRVRRMEPRIRELTSLLLDRTGGQSRVDFVDVFARPLPVHVSLALLGLPANDAELLDSLVRELHEEVATGLRTGAADKLTSYVRNTLLARREAGRPTMTVSSRPFWVAASRAEH